jgi:predicted transposase/invertase (TIGR01784 family)
MFQIDDNKIDPKIRDVYNMQFKPISELAKESFMRDAKEEGMKKGIKEGIKETQLAIAKNMLAREMPVYDIVSITGLSEKDVLALR